MADNVKITLSAHHQGKKPGDQLEVPVAEAKRLVGAGVAVPSTTGPAAAKALGVDQGTAATAQD